MTSASAAVRAPLVALFAIAVTAIAWIGSSAVCTRPLVIDPENMRAMTMVGRSGDGMMLCPVVIALMAISGALAAWSLVVFGRDRHRTVTLAQLLRCARRPAGPAAAWLAACGALAIAAILLVDATAVTLGVVALCTAVVVAGALTAIGSSLLLARLVLALGARLALVIPAALCDRTRAIFQPRRRRGPRVTCAVRAAHFGRGLRAPPSFVQ